MIGPYSVPSPGVGGSGVAVNVGNAVAVAVGGGNVSSGTIVGTTVGPAGVGVTYIGIGVACVQALSSNTTRIMDRCLYVFMARIIPHAAA